MQSLWPSLFGRLVDGQLYAMPAGTELLIWCLGSKWGGGEEGAQGPLMDRSPGTNSFPLSSAS